MYLFFQENIDANLTFAFYRKRDSKSFYSLATPHFLTTMFLFRGIHLIETNEEVCVFYEKLNIQGNIVFESALTTRDTAT